MDFGSLVAWLTNPMCTSSCEASSSDAQLGNVSNITTNAVGTITPPTPNVSIGTLVGNTRGTFSPLNIIFMHRCICIDTRINIYNWF